MKTTLKALMWILIISGILLGQFINASQNDYSIANDTGANVRADINSAFQAGQSLNSGTTAPSTMYAYQLWMDTSGGTPILKQRNAANSAWIIIGDGSLVGWGLLDRTGGTVSGELILSSTDDVKIPVGTTAQRNGSPVNGQFRYNSDLKNYEAYHESQFSQFQREVADADYISNVSLTASVGSNALTIALKTAAGANAAAGDPAIIGFRSATLGSGDVSLVKVTGVLSTVISSGSTAGHTSALESPIYIGALNNAGTVELCWSTQPFDENALISTTAEGGAGAADSATVIYSTTARSSVAVRLIGKLISTQTTAGTWAAVPTNIATGSSGKILPFVPATGSYYLTGSGTFTVPTSPRKPLWLEINMVGPGGGGAGSGGAGVANGTSGAAATTFGVLSAGVGNGGSAGGGVGGTGGTASCGGVATCLAIDGANGQPGGYSVDTVGGSGGVSCFGGAGSGGVRSGTGLAAKTNSGSGGGGAGGNPTYAASAGGGAGACIRGKIFPPFATSYSYVVGCVGAGNGGVAGAGGQDGASGACGNIEVIPHYQ